jgi:hypothetical protein
MLRTVHRKQQVMILMMTNFTMARRHAVVVGNQTFSNPKYGCIYR